MAGESAAESARRMKERAERLRRSAEHYERGAEGERATADVLATLPVDEWTIFHDVRWPGRTFANVDHVVVGPPGVFVIDSKNWSGRIDTQNGILRQNGRSRHAPVTGVTEAATAVSQLTQVVMPNEIVPVLCFAREQAVTGRVGNVLMCSTVTLRQMLVTRAPRLTASERGQLCRDLAGSFRSAAGRSLKASAARDGRSQPARRQRLNAVARPVGAIVAGAMVVGFVLSDLPSQFGRVFVSVIDSGMNDDQPPVEQERGRSEDPTDGHGPKH